MPMDEAQTRRQLIDPVLQDKGYHSPELLVIETPPQCSIAGPKGDRGSGSGRADYLLLAHVHGMPRPMPIAVIEAKSSDDDSMKGIQQAKSYADCHRYDMDCRRHGIKYAFSTNGHQFVEYSLVTGMQTEPRSIADFPTHEALIDRYVRDTGVDIRSNEAQILFQEDHSIWNMRYYQDAAIRAAFEKIIDDRKNKNPPRILLSLATGSGKTIIAVDLLWRLMKAGELKKPALFLCDRKELRNQAIGKFQAVFGDDAKVVKFNRNENAAKNAYIHIATYQSLGLEDDDEDSTTFSEHYEKNAFSIIVIDECHRSAWKKWREVLTRNPNSIQVGLTATPRKLKSQSFVLEEDIIITADNIEYFGDPVYEYTLTQAQEDGYLAMCEVVNCRPSIDAEPISKSEVVKSGWDIVTGQGLTEEEGIKEQYKCTDFDRNIFIVERVKEMCNDLFRRLCENGGPEQKVIIFCTTGMHADRVVKNMNNLYSEWCNKMGRSRKDDYAFKCMAGPNMGSNKIPQFRSSSDRAFIACTVDLLEVGIDIERLNAVSFFKYVRSPIKFHQMIGRGTRIDEATKKYKFLIYDYTNATDLFGDDFITHHHDERRCVEQELNTKILGIDGKVVFIVETSHKILVLRNDRQMLITIDEYLDDMRQRVIKEANTIHELKSIWIEINRRIPFVRDLFNRRFDLKAIQKVKHMENFDHYDILNRYVYGNLPVARSKRVEDYILSSQGWFDSMDENASRVLKEFGNQFKDGGIEALESRDVWSVPEITSAGGHQALKNVGAPSDLLREVKERLLST